MWRVVETEIISFARSEHHLTQTQCETNRKYTEMMKQVLSTPYFFFSYNYDLSHSRQRFEETIASSSEMMAQSLVQRAETRFVWNWKMMEGLRANPSLHRYCLPMIHRFISINQVNIAGTKLVWSIVSRRSIQRCGTPTPVNVRLWWVAG